LLGDPQKARKHGLWVQRYNLPSGSARAFRVDVLSKFWTVTLG